MDMFKEESQAWHVLRRLASTGVGRSIALTAATLLGGCVFEPKIVTKPSAAFLSLVPVGDVAAAPLPALDTDTCPLIRAKAALTQARMSRLFLNESTAAGYRDAVVWALRALENGCGEACGLHADAATQTYDAALEGLLRAVGCGPHGAARTASTTLEHLGVTLMADDGFMIDVEPDELWFARDYAAFRVREPMKSQGLGVPLMVVKKPRPRDDVRPEMFFPPLWKFAATAVARFADDGSGRLVVELVDPVENDFAFVAGSERPLAKDLTTPMIHLLSKSGYRDKSRRGLIIPNRMADEEGVMLTHPYRTGKIPFVLIHGMGCSPRIMADIACAVHADPILRSRYQVMIVYYTTGDTLLQDSAVIRRAFRAMRANYDPNHLDAAWDHSVVLGHSLGGPIARILTSYSDNYYEQAIFTRPWDQIVLSEAMRQAGEEAIFFEPIPEIERVIYVAATMKGSRIADQAEARALSLVIPRRRQLQEFYDEIVKFNGKEALQPSYRDRPPSSIDNQSPESPFLAAMQQLRQTPGLNSHSIQANWFPFLPTHLMTDGLVSYDSSYIPEASSRLVLDWQDHFCTHDPLTLAEIKRILFEHLGTVDVTPPFEATPNPIIHE